jgi:hypothetical protein
MNTSTAALTWSESRTQDADHSATVPRQRWRPPIWRTFTCPSCGRVVEGIYRDVWCPGQPGNRHDELRKMIENPIDLAKRRRESAMRKPKVIDSSRPPSLTDRFHLNFRRTKRCQWSGCRRLLSTANGKYCELHRDDARRERAAVRRNAKSIPTRGVKQGPEGHS